MNLKKKLIPAGILTLSLGYIYVYDLVYISDLRLQDHRSFGSETVQVGPGPKPRRPVFLHRGGSYDKNKFAQ